MDTYNMTTYIHIIIEDLPTWARGVIPNLIGLRMDSRNRLFCRDIKRLVVRRFFTKAAAAAHSTHTHKQTDRHTWDPWDRQLSTVSTAAGPATPQRKNN